MRDHAQIEELLAIRALGGLDEADEAGLRAAMAAHGDCDECRALERETAEATAEMALALQPVGVPDDLEEMTVARARDAGAPAGRPALERPDGSGPREGARVLRPRRHPLGRAWLRPVAAAAAAVVLFAGGWLAGSAGTAGPGFPFEGGRVATFEGAGAASLALVYRPGADGIAVVGSGLDRPASGKTYELWLFRGETPVRAACFEPTGAGGVVAFIDMATGGAHMAAVTVEPATCPSAPTTKPVLTASL